MVDCPREDCGGWLNRLSIWDWKTLGSGRILITWHSICPYCNGEWLVEEEFESTGYEKVLE